MKLPENTTSSQSYYEVEIVRYYHATVPVYYPAPDGGSYCNTATCTHRHADKVGGFAEITECGERLAGIIATGRLPKWATLSDPIAGAA